MQIDFLFPAISAQNFLWEKSCRNQKQDLNKPARRYPEDIAFALFFNL